VLLSEIIVKKHLKSDIFDELLVISNSQQWESNERIVSYVVATYNFGRADFLSIDINKMFPILIKETFKILEIYDKSGFS